MLKLLLSLICSGALCLAFSQQPAPMIFILDASGSMWGKIENQFKIEIARQVLNDLSKDLMSEREIGLLAYGHRQKGECGDIEWLLSPGTHTHESLTEKLKALNPIGMTPLAASAEHVIEFLKSQQRSATIILITDGLETCKGDLCKVVENAKAAGIDFVLHIVGFDLGESDKSVLECAARHGHGLYLDAADSHELDSVLNQVTALTVEKADATLSIKTTKGNELVDAIVRVKHPGESNYFASVRTYSHTWTNPAMLYLPTGIYDLYISPIGLRGVSDIVLSSVEVTADAVTERAVDFSSGKLSLLVTSNEKLHDATITLTSQTTNQNVAGGRSYASPESNPKLLELSPDTYTIKVRSVTIDGNNNEQVFNVVIEPGKTEILKCEIPHGILKVGASHQDKLWDCTINITAPGSNASLASGRTYASETTNPKSFLLTPGTYEVTLRPLKTDLAPIQFKTMIKANETTEAMRRF